MTTTETKDGNRRSLRTLLQVITAGAATVLIIVPMLTEFIDSWFPGNAITPYIMIAAAFTAGLSALLAKIMAIPAVDAFLSKIHLGKDATPARHRAE